MRKQAEFVADSERFLIPDSILRFLVDATRSRAYRLILLRHGNWHAWVSSTLYSYLTMSPWVTTVHSFRVEDAGWSSMETGVENDSQTVTEVHLSLKIVWCDFKHCSKNFFVFNKWRYTCLYVFNLSHRRGWAADTLCQCNSLTQVASGLTVIRIDQYWFKLLIVNAIIYRFYSTTTSRL